MDFSYVHIRYFIGYVYHICLQDTIQSTLWLCLRCQAMLLPMPLRPLLLTTRSGFSESRFRPQPLSFLLKLCVIVLQTHRYHPPKYHPNVKHHDGTLIFSHFARAVACLLACLLLACCLLLAAAKPGKSTLDTKKGYKTKTGST